MSDRYDVVVVGGRCAGSVLALRLARAGARVAIVDRDELGSDTLSTHALFPNVVARLDELGLLAPLLARHDVPFLRYRLRVLGFETVGSFTPVDGFDRAIAPRRVAFDRVIAEAALEAGAEGRFGQRVRGLIGGGVEGDPVRGVTLESGETIEADWTVGADGRVSTVAGALGLDRTRPLAADMSMLLAYWRGLPETDLLSLDVEQGRGLSRFPGEDGVQLLIVSGPPELTRGGPAARERAYLAALREFPTTLDPAAIDAAERITEVRSAPETMLRGYSAARRDGVGPDRRCLPLQASRDRAGHLGRDRAGRLRVRRADRPERGHGPVRALARRARRGPLRVLVPVRNASHTGAFGPDLPGDRV